MPCRPRLSANSEGGQQVTDEQIEVQAPAIIEEHGCRCGREDLGDAGQVVDGHRRYGWRIGVIGETAYAIKGEDFAVQQDAKGRAGKSVVGDGAFENGVGSSEAFPLTLRGADDAFRNVGGRGMHWWFILN